MVMFLLVIVEEGQEVVNHGNKKKSLEPTVLLTDTPILTL